MHCKKEGEFRTPALQNGRGTNHLSPPFRASPLRRKFFPEFTRQFRMAATIHEWGIMKLPRRHFLHLAAGAAALPAMSRVGRAQTYPTRPVRIVVGFTPAGASDIAARLIGQWLSERLGQQFPIENRAGAGGNIGTETVVRAPADGYTLLLAGSNDAINATLYEKLNFNFIRDIAPVASIVRVPNVMVTNLIGSGQDSSGVHCLRQGQSGQHQHGVGRHRNTEPHVRRAVQDDERRKHGSCAVSRWWAGADRPAGRTGASDI